MKRQSGTTLISILVAACIVGASAFISVSQSSKSFETLKKSKDIVIAEQYATELIEFLKYHLPDQLKEYLTLNPMRTLCPTCKPYKLCAHINYLDRDNPPYHIMNKDPIADLPPDSGLEGPSPETAANRYYQIFVADVVGSVNSEALKMNTAFCTQAANQIFLYGRTAQIGEALGLKAGERLFLKVGVSWVPRGKGVKDAKEVVVTSLMPEY